jgi:hypothetical protein
VKIVALAWCVIASGGLWRLVGFLNDPPFWIDEANLALNVAGRSFLGLLRPLGQDQIAPVGFLLAERLMADVGGVNELALRAIPAAAGIALPAAVWIVGRRVFGATTALIATAFAAFSPVLLYFSGEMKQYASDPLVTVLLLGLTVNVLRRPDIERRWWWLAAGAVMAVLWSQPAAFVIAPALVALALTPSIGRVPQRLMRAAAIASTSGMLFAVLYVAVYHPVAASPYMQGFWRGTFLTPGLPSYHARLQWFAASFVPIVDGYERRALVAVVWLFFAAGVLVVARSRGRPLALLLVGPPALCFVAALAGSYGVAPRLALFAAPLVYFGVAAALGAAIDAAPTRARLAILTVLVVAVAGTALPYASWARRRPDLEDARDLARDVNRVAGAEPVYVLASAIPAWAFYTTDWSHPDTARLSWIASVTSSASPAFENRASRGRPVAAGEGEALVRPYGAHSELLGIGTGMQYVLGPHNFVVLREGAQYFSQPHPDSGWAANEARRMRAAAAPGIWVFVAHSEPGQVADLRTAIEQAGGAIVGEWSRVNAAAYRVAFR